MVAQELVAHDLTPYYHNNKRKGEVDFLIEIGGQVLPIEVKSGKDYGVHRALANIMDCRECGLKEAMVFCNDNLHTVGKHCVRPHLYDDVLAEKATWQLCLQGGFERLKHVNNF